MRPSAARAKHAAALALAAALAVAVWLAIAYPLSQVHRHYDDRIAALRASLERYGRVAQGRAETDRRLEEEKRGDAAQPYYLAHASPALASAQLQGLVKRAVAQAGGELISTQVLTGQRPEPVGDAVVGVRARGGMRALQRMLFELESGLPMLFVERLSVDAQSARDLHVAFEVRAFTRTRQSPAKATPPPRSLFAFAELPHYAEVVERALFERSRRAPSGAAAPVAAPRFADDLVLAGVLVRTGRKVALLQRSGSERLIGLDTGSTLDGWQLVEVREDAIVLRRGSHWHQLGIRK